MTELEQVSANVERERYRLLCELERFNKLKEQYMQLVERAQTDPRIAAQLSEFEKAYGPEFKANTETLKAEIRKANDQYQLFIAMKNQNSSSFPENQRSLNNDSAAAPEKKEKVKSILQSKSN
ncbi:hypothetical protein [unidentified bacterial endosymbiont]|uniref:hypothetical protein n=1 Tax=unidentified bacterial endosymbiont TaxID=2355 RepID=UPI0020A0A330|nr:hypothetical protein [unidentified bacterial endosymbiont]